MPDISQLLAAKSDQSNAADLINSEVTGRILRIQTNVNAQQQPMSIWMDCLPPGKPWRPCKTAMRIMAHAWGTEDTEWVGRRATLYFEPEVTYDKHRTGGIRIRALSHTQPFRISLQERRGKYRMWEIASLPTDGPTVQSAPPDLDAVLGDLEISRDELDAHLVAEGRPKVADLTDAQRVALAAALPRLADKIRARRTA